MRRKSAMTLASDLQSKDLELDRLSTIRNVIERPDLLASDRIYEGVNTLLKTLSEIEHINLAVYTARQKRTELVVQMKNLGLTQYFSAIINTGGRPKKREDLDSLALCGNIVAYIGDTEEDLQVSKSLGASFFQVPPSISKSETPDFSEERSFFAVVGELLLIKL